MDLKEMRQTIWDKVSFRRVRAWGMRAGRAGLGFLLASGTVFGAYAPFGLGYVAALGVGKHAVYGFLGTAIGYFSILYRANGLKYLAILALICAAAFAFSEKRFQKILWLMPLCAAVSAACLGFVFLLDDGISLQEFSFYITEVLLVFGTTFLYRAFFHPEGRVWRAGLARTYRRLLGFCLCATLLLPLAPIRVLDTISIGRAGAELCVMLCGYYGNMGLGVVCAILQGLAAGTESASALYCAIYGSSVICACLLKKWGKVGYLSGFTLVSLGAMLVLQTKLTLALGLETLVSAALFFPVALRFGASIKAALQDPKSEQISLQKITQRSLKLAAKAFSDLGDMLHGTFAKGGNPQNIVSVFERPARQVCKKCVLCNRCWGQEYPDTRNALNDVTQVMQQNGQLRVTDLPFHFSTRCLHIGEFVELINQELRAYQTKRQYQTRLRARQDVLCKQYREVSGVLESLAQIEPPVQDVSAQKHLMKMLEQAGVSAQSCVYRDAHHRLHILLEGETESEEVLQNFAEARGISLGTILRSKSAEGYCFRASERETLQASLGVACRKKQGNCISGDTVGHCKQPDGTLCILLADGMGTGLEAARESNLAVDLLIRFLETGIAPQSALATIHSALQLKGEVSTAFTTLDLLCVNLYSGESELYKFGSAPSYYRRSGETKCVTCTSMPLGISCAGAPGVEQVRCTLKAGDDVVLISDGVSDQAVVPWLMQTLKEKHTLSAQEFAREILLRAEAEAEDADDRTVLVFRLSQE